MMPASDVYIPPQAAQLLVNMYYVSQTEKRHSFFTQWKALQKPSSLTTQVQTKIHDLQYLRNATVIESFNIVPNNPSHDRD